MYSANFTAPRWSTTVLLIEDHSTLFYCKLLTKFFFSYYCCNVQYMLGVLITIRITIERDRRKERAASTVQKIKTTNDREDQKEAPLDLLLRLEVSRIGLLLTNCCIERDCLLCIVRSP